MKYSFLNFYFICNVNLLNQIGSDGIGLSIVILLGMLVSIITIIHFQGWMMTRNLGLFMLALYFVFLVQAIIRELPFEDC